MEREIENVENRFRNKLTPFRMAAHVLKQLSMLGPDEVNAESIYSYIKSTNLDDIVEKNVDWFIKAGQAIDKKIDDKTFNIEEEISNL